MSSAGQGRDQRFPGAAFRLKISGFQSWSLARCTVKSVQYGVSGDAWPAVWTEWLWGAFPQTVTSGLATASWAGLDADAVPGAVTVTTGLATASWAGLDATVVPGAVTVTSGLATASWAGLDATVVPGAVTVTSGLATASWAGLDADAVPGAVTVTSGLATASWAGLDAAATATTPIVVVAGRANASWSGLDASASDNAPAPRRKRGRGFAAGGSPWERRPTVPVPVPPLSLAPAPPSGPAAGTPGPAGGTTFGQAERRALVESAALKMAMALQGKTRAAAMFGVTAEGDDRGTMEASAEIGALLEDE